MAPLGACCVRQSAPDHCKGRCRQSGPGGICNEPAALAELCCDPGRYVLPDATGTHVTLPSTAATAGGEATPAVQQMGVEYTITGW